MGGAIWSCSLAQMEAFPAKFFVRFFINHGLLALRNRPQWYVVPGGSSRYVEALRAACGARFHTATPVTGVRRDLPQRPGPDVAGRADVNRTGHPRCTALCR